MRDLNELEMATIDGGTFGHDVCEVGVYMVGAAIGGWGGGALAKLATKYVC